MESNICISPRDISLKRKEKGTSLEGKDRQNTQDERQKEKKKGMRHGHVIIELVHSSILSPIGDMGAGDASRLGDSGSFVSGSRLLDVPGAISLSTQSSRCS